MKKFCVVLIVMAFVCGLQAQERQLMKVNVPFTFMAENASFPAGSYTVYLLNPFNMLRVQGVDRGPSANVRGLPSQIGSKGKSEWVFARIDGKYFLKEVRESDNNIQRELPLGKSAENCRPNVITAPRVDGMVAITAH